MPTKKTTSTQSTKTATKATTGGDKAARAPAKKTAAKSTTTKPTATKAAPKKATPKNASPKKASAPVSPDEVTLAKATKKAAPTKKPASDDVSVAAKKTAKPQATKATAIAARETSAGAPFIQLDALREELALLAKRNGLTERGVDDVKQATLVYTRDRWATYETAALTERPVRVRGFTLPKLDDDTRVEFAVKASFDEDLGAALWLNNRGRNYAAVWKNAH